MTLYRKANKLRLITLAKAPALVSFSILHKNLIDYNRIKLKNKKCARHETGIKEIKNKNHLISPPKKDLEKDFYLEGQRVVGICLFVLIFLNIVRSPGTRVHSLPLRLSKKSFVRFTKATSRNFVARSAASRPRKLAPLAKKLVRSTCGKFTCFHLRHMQDGGGRGGAWIFLG